MEGKGNFGGMNVPPLSLGHELLLSFFPVPPVAQFNILLSLYRSVGLPIDLTIARGN